MEKPLKYLKINACAFKAEILNKLYVGLFIQLHGVSVRQHREERLEK